MRVSLFAILGLPLLLSGCALTPTALPSAASGLTIRGNVHGGQQPISGARVYLLAAGTSGYGSASTSILSSNTDGSDLLGGYVLTAADGSFSFPTTAFPAYTCTPNTQVYIYALGGNPGAGVNSAAGLLAVLGNCPASGSFATTVPFVSVNEVTTVAAAYAFSAFATDATHVGSSGTTAALAGIANAFANAANLVDLASGQALTTTPAGNGTVPQQEINTLANILAACINSTGPASTPCSTLLSNAMSSGTSGTVATDTATAAINIAHNPVATVTALYGIPGATLPFAPTLAAQPNDFTLTLTFTGGGIASANHLAIDSTGSVWSSNSTALAKLSPLGATLSPSSGFTDSSLNGAAGLAIDASDNVWATNSNAYSLTEFSATGQFLNLASAPLNSLYLPRTAAIDAAGNIWVPTSNGIISNLVEFASNGNYTTSILSGLLSQPQAISIDGTGNIWVANDNSAIGEFSSAGVPQSLSLLRRRHQRPALHGSRLRRRHLVAQQRQQLRSHHKHRHSRPRSTLQHRQHQHPPGLRHRRPEQHVVPRQLNRRLATRHSLQPLRPHQLRRLAHRQQRPRASPQRHRPRHRQLRRHLDRRQHHRSRGHWRSRPSRHPPSPPQSKTTSSPPVPDPIST